MIVTHAVAPPHSAPRIAAARRGVLALFWLMGVFMATMVATAASISGRRRASGATGSVAGLRWCWRRSGLADWHWRRCWV